ncbi:MAG: type II toxin-antitoxin system VapB family antitoxin, partial [Balneolales bacterium]|nr:type II toxin-antitoxin system VapB family antitoxin [Balneolales bacterium]
MRTNIDIDNKLMDEAVKYSGLSTKKEIVHEALRVLVQREKQKRIRNYRG